MSKHIKISAYLDRSNIVEKDIDGKKSRYLAGIASGLKADGHGEHVTERCISSMCSQAEAGDILLYADHHDFNSSEDIGILESFKVLENGDWYVEFRLYDESDGVDDASIQRADKLWAQVNGLPPYTRARRKGFSIEGEIPNNAILQRKKINLGIIDDIVLKGIVIVPEPAYKDSYVHAIYKALDIEPPWKIRKAVQKRLTGTIKKDRQAQYDRDRYDIEEERDRIIAEIIKKNGKSDIECLTEELKSVFNEYSDLAIGLIIMNNETLVGSNSNPVMASPYMADSEEDVDPTRMSMLTDLERQLEEFTWSRRVNENPQVVNA